MSIYYVGTIPYSDSLTHHGIKGQKWGIRRYQNPDGTLTSAGKERYSVSKETKAKAIRKDIDTYNKAIEDMNKYGYRNGDYQDKEKFDKAYKQYNNSYEKIASYGNKSFNNLKNKYIELRDIELDMYRDSGLAKKFGYNPKLYKTTEEDERAYDKAERKYFNSLGIDSDKHYDDVISLSYTAKEQAKALSNKLLSGRNNIAYREVLARVLEDSMYNDYLKRSQEVFK